MTSMKSVRMLILALGLMTIVTASSFAAVPFFTSSTVNIVPTVAQTALSGSILYTALIGGTVSAGEIINVAYQSPVSMLQDITVSIGANTLTAGTITAYGTAYQVGALAGVTVTVNQKPVNTLVISFGAPVTFAVGEQIQISGVRLDFTNNGVAVENGTSTVFITNTTGQATVINPLLTVATFAKPLDKPVISNGLSWNADGEINEDEITISVKELFTNAFDTRGTGNTYATRVQFEITGIPPGIAYNTAWAIDMDGVDVEIYSNAGSASTRTIVLRINDQDGNIMQRAAFGIQFYVSDPALLPVSWPSTFAVRAKLIDPYTGDYTVGSSVPLTNRLRFKELYTESSSIGGSIEEITSILISTFNQARKNQAGAWIFDTGFAVNNTSGSGFFWGEWFPGAQPGAITVCLYPQAGGASSPKCFKTDATNKPGVGLDANGMLPAKATWTVLLSDILKVPAINLTEFTGYVSFLCDFRGAQGVNFIADGMFEDQAQGYQMYSTDNFLWSQFMDWWYD